MGCSGKLLRKLLGVSQRWRQCARNAAASPEWIEAHVDRGRMVADISWAIRSPASEDLDELLSRLPDGVMRLSVDGKLSVDAAPLLTKRQLSGGAIRCLPVLCDGRQVSGSVVEQLQHAAALLAIKKSRMSITEIGNSAFQQQKRLTSLTLPDGVTTIGNEVFRDCSGLTSIPLPSSLTTIGRSAFQGCSGLTSITLPEGLASIDDLTFCCCFGLTAIALPESLVRIGMSAFKGCSPLASLTLPEGVTMIGNEAFEGC